MMFLFRVIHMFDVLKDSNLTIVTIECNFVQFQTSLFLFENMDSKNSLMTFQI